MEKYSEYKDVKNKWLVYLPFHWGTPQLKYLTSKIGSGSTPDGGSAVYVDKGIKFIRSQNVYNNHFQLEDVVYITELTHQKMKGTHVRSGDILFNITGGSLGRCYIVDDNFGDANVNQHVAIVRPQGINGKFLLYYLQSDVGKKQVDLYQTGGNREGLTAQAFGKFMVAYPPLSEQSAIVSYLDDATAKMDKFVTKKEQEIELLEKLKQRIIADAVTKGLDPNAEMVPSDIPWIKQIPKGWNIKKIKYCFTEHSRKGYPNEPTLCATQSRGVIPQSMYENRVVVVNKNFDQLKLVKKGDFVISLRSFEGGIEYAYFQGIISAAYTILEPNDASQSNYFKYLFKSHYFIQLLKTCVIGIREGQNINYPMLSKQFLPIPPIEEQQAIVDYIKDKSDKIDKLKSGLQQEIEKVKLYKQRLISDVVTGQIKVC